MSPTRIMADVSYIDQDGDERLREAIVRVDVPKAGEIRIDISELDTRRGEAVLLTFDQVELAAAIATARANPEGA
jgi:hypothetical protein